MANSKFCAIAVVATLTFPMVCHAAQTVDATNFSTPPAIPYSAPGGLTLGPSLGTIPASGTAGQSMVIYVDCLHSGNPIETVTLNGTVIYQLQSDITGSITLGQGIRRYFSMIVPKGASYSVRCASSYGGLTVTANLLQ